MIERRPTVINLVIDAMGIDTLQYLLNNSSMQIDLPNLTRMGLGNLLDGRFNPRIPLDHRAQFAHAIEQASTDADSVIGHREMVGLVDTDHYPLFMEGFPTEFIKALEQTISRRIVYNKRAGWDTVVEEAIPIHEVDDHPIIVYASMCDPLIQLAANEKYVSAEALAKFTDVAFQLAMQHGIKMTRGISRPFVVEDGEVTRTARRHDAVLPASGKTLIDVLRDNAVWTVSVGKPAELILGTWDEKIKLTDERHLDPSIGYCFPHEKGKDTNPFSIQGTINALKSAHSCYRPNGTFIFVNCVDTDSLYGHVMDVEGSLKSLQEVDRMLGFVTPEMLPGDVLIVTADHGMEHKDYGYHSKEKVPLLARCVRGEPLTDSVLLDPKAFVSVGYLVAQQYGLDKDFIDTIERNA